MLWWYLVVVCKCYLGYVRVVLGNMLFVVLWWMNGVSLL